jgi:Phosphotransferase enzyme family
VLNRPDGLPETEVAAALAREWRIDADALDYLPVGFGSYHWRATGPGGRWFVTADDLRAKRWSAVGPPAAAWRRLRASLATAAALREHGQAFVVAPLPAASGDPAVRVAEAYALAVYPYLEGESFAWDDVPTAEHRRAVLDMLTALHGAPPAAAAAALPDNFAVPLREELTAVAGGAGPAQGHGPFGPPAAALIHRAAVPLRRMLARYDQLTDAARRSGPAAVLTHGEPHPGNTMRTADGWRLIDWDMVMLAPAERDLWWLDPGAGSMLAAYADAAGRTPRPDLLELYRLQWDLADLAEFGAQLTGPHPGNDDDAKSFGVLESLVARAERDYG